MEKNIFEQIRDREAPANIVYQDEYVTAFDDIVSFSRWSQIRKNDISF
jgi:diadenosine tetraphosphate (Ap4A) HIT family hydrolase